MSGVIHVMLQWLVGVGILLGGSLALTLAFMVWRYLAGILFALLIVAGAIFALTEGLRELGAAVLH